MERGPGSDHLGRAVLFVVAAGAGALTLYLVHPLASGYHLPVGPDGPVYTWLARHAAVAGFGDVPGGGPGVPALTLTLGTILGTVPLQTVALLGPVLAVLCGLAGAAALESSLGPHPWRAAAGVALTAGFAGFLAGGWLANVALVAAFLAAVAALALATTSWRPVVLAGALIAAGGLAHRLFLAAAVLIVLLAAAAGMREIGRARSRGRPPIDNGPFREAAAALGAAGIVAAVLAWIGAGPRLDVDTSQDGFFRRLDLRELLVDRYRERFLGDLTRAAVPLVGGFALTGVWLAEANRWTPGESFLRRVIGAWATVTVAGVVILTATSAGPANRALQFAFFLPVAAAAGVAVLARWRRLGAWLGAAAVAVFVAASLVGWSRQAPAFEPDELRVLQRAAPLIEALPRGTPLVFLVDTDEPAAAYHVTRAANVIRSGVPAERIGDVHIAVGRPGDFLAGRTTLTGDQEHDAISRAYAARVVRLRDRAATFVIGALNERGYEEATDGGIEVGSGIVLLDGGAAPVVQPAPEPDPPVGSTDGLELLALAFLAPAALLVLGLLGGGWTLWGLRAADPRAAILAAPSVGLAVAILGTVAADRAGMAPGGGGSLAVVLLGALAGYVAARR